MKKRFLIIAGIVVLISLVVFLVGNKGAPVEKVEVDNIRVVKTVSSSGWVISESEATLSFQAGGDVYSIYPKNGDLVEKGALIAALSNTGQGQDLQVAQKSLDVAKADLALYVKNYSSNINAVGGEDEYWLGYNRLQKLVDGAEAAYQSQAASFRKTYIYAPFTGTIVDVFKETGESASPGEPVIKIADLDKLKFNINIDQEDFGLLLEQQEVEITLDTHRGDTFRGFISELPKYASPTTEEFNVKISFDPEEERTIYLGAAGDARVIIEATQKEVPALTFDQIIEDPAGKYFVWAIENGKLRKVYIEIGLEGDLYTEVKTDISNTIIVTSENPSTFSEGMKVRLAN